MHPSVILLRKSFAASGANNVWGSLIAAECLYVIPAADSFEVTVGDSMIPTVGRRCQSCPFIIWIHAVF